MDNVGEKLKEFFKEKGLTQMKVAEITGTQQSYIAALLNGSKQFGKKQAQKWGDIFGLSPNWLLTGVGEMCCNPSSVIQQNQNGDNINGHSVKVDQKTDIEKLLDTIKGCNDTIRECHELLRKKDEQIDRLLTLLEKK